MSYLRSKFPSTCWMPTEMDMRVVQMVKEFPEVFTDELGCLKDFQVHIPVSADS